MFITRVFLITGVASFAFVECQYFSSQSAKQGLQIQNQIYSSPDRTDGGQNYGSKIQDSTNIRQRLVPAALISSMATPVNYPPLKISVRQNARLLIKNKGILVELEPTVGNVATLTGGPADSKVFDFLKLAQTKDFYANNTRVGSTEDGVGFPMQLSMFFYDRSLGCVENALNYEQGIITIIFHVLVIGKVPNPLFEPYRSAVAQISKPNSTATISAYDAFEWLLSTLDTGYYVYPSSYYLPSTGKQIPCATEISPNFNNHPWLSYSQWETVENLLDSNYQPQAHIFSLFSLAGRSFTQAGSPVSVCYD